MEKTKLGLSVEAMAVAVVLASYFGGYVAMALIVGYILLKEDNDWLKKLAVKVAVLVVGFSFINSALYLIPNVVTCIDGVFGLLTLDFTVPMLSQIINVCGNILDIVKKFIFLVMGYQALSHTGFAIPVVDAFVDKHFGQKAE